MSFIGIQSVVERLSKKNNPDLFKVRVVYQLKVYN